VGGEAFRFGERLDDGSDPAQAGGGEFLHGDDFDEVEDAETATEAGGACGGEDVVSAGSVVSGRLRRVVADEDGAGVAQGGEIAAGERDVLAGDGVGPV